jgi:hypothetical protein
MGTTIKSGLGKVAAKKKAGLFRALKTLNTPEL